MKKSALFVFSALIALMFVTHISAGSKERAAASNSIIDFPRIIFADFELISVKRAFARSFIPFHSGSWLVDADEQGCFYQIPKMIGFSLMVLCASFLSGTVYEKRSGDTALCVLGLGTGGGLYGGAVIADTGYAVNRVEKYNYERMSRLHHAHAVNGSGIYYIRPYAVRCSTAVPRKYALDGLGIIVQKRF